jgi:hypothetical protein
MTMSNAAEQALLDLLFLNIDWANVGDAAGLQNSAAAGNFYVRLHTADPGEGGDGSTNEVSYTGYSPPALARSGAGFTRVGSTVSNAALVQCGKRTDVGTTTATYFSICTAPTGAAQIIVSAPLDDDLIISQNVNPQFGIGVLQATAD